MSAAKTNTCQSQRGSSFVPASDQTRISSLVDAGIMVESDASFTSSPSFTSVRGSVPPRWIVAEVEGEAPQPPADESSHPITKSPQWAAWFFVLAYTVSLGLACAVILLTLMSAKAVKSTPARSDGHLTYTIEEVLDGMKTNLHNPNLQTRGCIVVWALAENAAGRDSWTSVQHDLILEVMERYRFHSELQQHCLRAIGSLLPTKRGLSEKTLISTVLRTMDADESNIELQTEAIVILSRIPRSILQRSSASVVPVVLRSLHRYTRNEKILKGGIDLLNLLSNSEVEEKSDVSADDSVADNIASLISANLRLHNSGGVTSCQRFGSAEIRTSEAIILGALDILLQIESRKHNGSSLVTSKNHRVRAKEELCAQTIDPLWSVMGTFESGEILRKALRVLTSLAESGKGTNPFQLCLALKNEDAVLEKMSRNSSDEAVQFYGSRLLSFFPNINPPEKLIPVLTKAMRIHEANKDVVQSSLSVLADLNSLHAFETLFHYDIHIVVNAIWRFSRDEEILANSCNILVRYVEFSPSPNTDVLTEALQALSHGVYVTNESREARAEFYLTAMLYFPSNEAIQELCMQSLARVGPINQDKALFDAVRGAYRTFGKHNAAIRKHALDILGAISRSSASTT